MSQTINFKGQPIAIAGQFPAKGSVAPDFTLVTKDLSDVSLGDYAGKRKVLNIFPSIDTSTCATSVRKFNQLASDITNTVVLCISADLPFAQSRFCGADGLDNVITLSAFRGSDFKNDYAVVVLDENNTVLHAELVEEIAQEPDYDAALAVLK